MKLTISHLKTFCALRGCTLRVGNREIGYIDVDADGFINPRAYSSFNPAGEMIGRPNPTTLLRMANEFVIKENGGTQMLNREEFLKMVGSVVGVGE